MPVCLSVCLSGCLSLSLRQTILYTSAKQMAFFVAYLSIMCKQGVLEDKNQLGHYLDIFSPNLCIRTFKAFKCALSFANNNTF